jgi:FixJ family two-component response regulator
MLATIDSAHNHRASDRPTDPLRSSVADRRDEEGDHGRPRIAVIDDERAYAFAAALALAPDHEVAPFTEASVFLDRVAAGERFYLVLADVFMPEMSGIRMLQVLRFVAPEQAERVYFLSGFASDLVPRKEIAGRVFEKPTTPDALMALVDKLARR